MQPDAALIEAIAQAVAEKLTGERPALLDTEAAIAFVGVSRTEFYRLRSAGKIPDPVHLEGSRPRYRRADLELFVARLKPARQRAAAVRE